MTQGQAMPGGIVMEEHPELDNPRDRANHAVIGLTVQLDEAREAVTKAESGLALAKEEVAHREQVLLDAKNDSDALVDAVSDAEAHLAETEKQYSGEGA